VLVFVAAKLFAGGDGLAPLRAAGCADPARALALHEIRRRSLGGADILIEGLVSR
jgi:hypothetical protein